MLCFSFYVGQVGVKDKSKEENRRQFSNFFFRFGGSFTGRKVE